MKGIVEVWDRGKTYCDYVSKNGIRYELNKCVSIGKGVFETDTLIIFLDIDDSTCPNKETQDTLWTLIDCSRQIVDFMQMDGDDSTYGLNEEAIERSIDEYEENHKELIDFIIANNIETY